MVSSERHEILGLLRSMGIELPRKTKLPNIELDKRLSKALDSCQYLSRVIPSPPLNPIDYSLWKGSNEVLEAVRRHNWGEATLIHDSKAEGLGNPFPLYANAFMDLRQSMMSVGHCWDIGGHAMIFQDKDQQSAICMRSLPSHKILEIREFDPKTPIIIVFLRPELGPLPSKESPEWLSSYVDGEAEMGSVTATLEEQQLLLRLLNQNSKRIAPSYKPKRPATERSLTLSFLLPIGPLGAREVGSYSKNDGCSLCGELARNKCSRCGVIRYCGPACQKDDWKIHRSLCSSLKGATWQNLTCTSSRQPRPGVQALWISRFTNVQHGEIRDELGKLSRDGPQPPPNVHGSMPYIVKVQLNSASSHGPGWPVLEMARGRPLDPARDGTSMLIYDRQRTFEVSTMKDGRNADGFEKVAQVVRTKGYGGLKVFCWAIRRGDWAVDLCLDQLPEWQNW